MAVIPLTPARGAPQVNGPPLARNLGGPAATMQAQGEAIERLGDTLGRLAEVERRASEQMAHDRARGEALQVMAEAESASNGDVDAYRSRTAAGFQRIADGMPQRQRERFLAGIQPEAAGVEFRIRRTGALRLHGEANGARETRLGEYLNRAVFGEAGEREAYRARGLEAIQEGIASGTLSQAQARTRAQRWNAEVSAGIAERMIRETPGEAEALLRDPAALPGLSPAQRFRLLDRATRQGRRGAGGVRRGGGPRAEIEGLDGPQIAALEAEGEAWANEEDERDLAEALQGERVAFTAARDAATGGAEGWFRAAAGDGQADGSVAEWATDLLPAPIRGAMRAVAMRGADVRDDPGALGELLPAVHAMEPATFQAEAAREVEAGRLSPAGWVRLTGANREAQADTPAAAAWRQVRAGVAAQLIPPEAGDLVPGLPDLSDARREALAEVDEWRAANPNAPASAAQAETRAIVARHREAMADALAGALPPITPYAPYGPYAPALLDETEMDIIGALDAGEVDEAEAARRLRLLEAWRWVAGEEGEEEPPEPARGGRGGRMRLR